MTVEAWVNWNPEPKVHAYGEAMGTRPVHVALCRITVRDRRGEFDPDASDACPECASYVREGLTVGEAQQRAKERTRGAFVIECRRGGEVTDG